MVKRTFDLFVSCVGLALLAPLLLAIAVAIATDSKGPVFYRGLRAGRGGRPFKIFKFRTMVVDADRIGGPSTPADDPRVTPIGAFLRRHKLDELPQLINVLIGDMSLVGPRPEVIEEVGRYSPEEARLLRMRPGITDWASIAFRNEADILRGSADPHQAYREKIRPEKIRLGLEYVENHSLIIDFKILLRTIKVVAR